jgi:hypothetical protein
MMRCSRGSAVAAALAAVALGFALAAPASAAPAVTNTNDSGPGSLRDAIANASPGDTVNVPAGTYTLSSGQLDVNKTLTIAGAGARTTTITAASTSRVMRTSGNPVTLTGLTITGGKVDLSTLQDCQGGGGICNLGTLVISDSAIVGNVANVNIANQNAPGGGGIFNNGDNVTIANSTIANNQANVTTSNLAGGGGGYFSNGTGPTITNSTIANNTATVNGSGSRHGGGGIYLNGSVLTATNVTIAGNSVGGSAPTSGGNLFVDNSQPAVVKNSIVANGTAPSGANCDKFGANLITSSGGNVESADTCGFSQASDKRNADPLLGALADNGGQTDTMALQAGSPAIDAAVDCPPPATDQRGQPRPQGAGCDSGAFEVQPVAAPPPPPRRVLPRPSCLSIPNVVRDRIAPLRGGGKVVLLTRQVDDPVNPLLLAVRLRARGAIAAVSFTVNGHALPAGTTASAAAAVRLSQKVPVALLRIGSRRNVVRALVRLRDGRRVRLTQFLVILRCHVPALACRRLAGNHLLRCRTNTPLGVLRVRVTATGPGNQVARGSATVRRGRYTVLLTSRSVLPPGVYVYKHVGTTRRRGERFFMVRLFTVQ